MNNALGIGADIDTTKSGVAAFEDNHTDNAMAIRQASPLRAVREADLAPPSVDAHQLDMFADEDA